MEERRERGRRAGRRGLGWLFKKRKKEKSRKQSRDLPVPIFCSLSDTIFNIKCTSPSHRCPMTGNIIYRRYPEPSRLWSELDNQYIKPPPLISCVKGYLTLQFIADQVPFIMLMAFFFLFFVLIFRSRYPYSEKYDRNLKFPKSEIWISPPFINMTKQITVNEINVLLTNWNFSVDKHQYIQHLIKFETFLKCDCDAAFTFVILQLFWHKKYRFKY